MKGMTRNDLPASPVPCNIAHCVYQGYGSCDNPRLNRQNSDAACSMMNVKDLLAILKDAAEGEKR